MHHSKAPLTTDRTRCLTALVITSHGLAVEGIRQLLRRECERVEIEATSDLSGAISTARSFAPELIVLGAECAGVQPIGALKSLKAAAPECRLMLLVTPAQCQWFSAMVENGADAILMHESSTDSFAAALRNALQGVPYLDRAVQLQIMRAVAEPEPSGPKLTPREMQVLQLVARGNANKAIGRTLGLSEGTVKTYLRRLRKRLGARDRTHAAIHALALGLVEIERNGSHAASMEPKP